MEPDFSIPMDQARQRVVKVRTIWRPGGAEVREVTYECGHVAHQIPGRPPTRPGDYQPCGACIDERARRRGM